MKDSFHNIFNEINLFHIAFITTISVFLKEFIYFLLEYFEEFSSGAPARLKDSIGKSNSQGNVAKDIPSILNQADNNGSPSEPKGSGSGTKGSGGKSIAEDWRNYQFDSDSDSDFDLDSRKN